MTQNIKCKRCNYELNIPDLTIGQKKNLTEMKRAGLDLQIVQQIQNLTHIGLKNSKAIMEHINPEYGKCHRCNYSGLNTEYVICPKCKSINTNW